MKRIKIFLFIVFALILCYGSWYLVMWFLTNQSNILSWPWYVKLIFLLMGAQNSNKAIEMVRNKMNR